jgi:hypothetical protein
LLSDRDKMSNLYRGPSIDAPYQVSVHLAKRLIRNKNCLWWPYLLMDRDKMCNLEKGPSTDASYQVSVHLAEGFQRRWLKCEKLMNDRRRTTDTKRWQKLTLSLFLKMETCHGNIVYGYIVTGDHQYFTLLGVPQWEDIRTNHTSQ